MNCPVCKNPMIILELEQVETDYCSECGGIWLDAGELELLFEDSSQARRLVESFEPACGLKEKKRLCPICLKNMDKVLAGSENQPVIIDRCANSHGLWFDRGELSGILEKGNFDKEKKVVNLLAGMFGEK